MKKLILLVLMVTTLLPVSACSKKEEVKENAKEEVKEEYLVLTESNVEQYVDISFIKANEITNERVEDDYRVGDWGVQVVVTPTDGTVINSISIKVRSNAPSWSVAGSNEMELNELLDGFYGTFWLKAKSKLVNTSLSMPDEEDISVTITSVDGVYYYE